MADITRRARALAAAATALFTAAALAGCGGDDSGGEDETLLVWTVEDVADRVEAQKALLAEFTKATGVQAELVAIAEDDLPTVLASAAAADELPDVVGALSLTAVNQLRTDDLLDTGAAGEVVDSLGEGTFAEAALNLTRADDEQLAVPSDAWSQLLFYRKDLFAQAGLAPPTSYDAIAAAAARLDAGDTTGIVAGTAPNDSFTHQTFEQLALANDCELVDDGGAVTLDSPPCQETFRFYSDLIRQHSVAGNQDADTTRAAYFAGRAAMVIWSSFMLDELAGLRNDALPTCPQCKADPAFLAKNTGVVAALQGPDGSGPATFGEIVSWAILRDSAGGSKQFVEYMMNDGYEKWLAVAPEGKVPTRRGTSDDAEKFVTAWEALPIGVDTKRPLDQVLDAETLEAVGGSPENVTRWGLPQGQGELAGAVAGQFVVPQALAGALSGDDAASAARTAAEEAEKVKKDIGS
jgi:multiple sugar transport system substrate-binding protein